MADDEETSDDGNGEGDEERSFRERVEELREERGEGEDPREAMMGGGPGGMGGPGGGNPFAQMMGGMMGGGPGGMGGGPGGGGSVDPETFTRELEGLREAVRDATDELARIADALEDD